MVLTGWRVMNSEEVLAPGASVQLSEDNTLTARWTTAPAADNQATVDTAPGSTSAAKKVVVVWNRDGTVVRSGDPTELMGLSPRITIQTMHPNRVKPVTIAAAKRLAKRFDGEYAGVIESKRWRSPRIVAVGRP